MFTNKLTLFLLHFLIFERKCKHLLCLQIVGYNTRMAIEVRLKDVRKKRGLTQLKLAYKLDMTPQYVQKIENDKTKSINKETLDKLCQVLDCQVSDILVYVP